MIKSNYVWNWKIFFFDLLEGSYKAFSSGDVIEKEIEIEVNQEKEAPRKSFNDNSPLR